jgi:hypothetical protein
MDGKRFCISLQALAGLWVVKFGTGLKIKVNHVSKILVVQGASHLLRVVIVVFERN